MLCSLPALEVHPTFTVRKAVSFHTFWACLLGLGIGLDSDKNLSTWIRQSLRTQPNPRTQPHWHRWPDSQTLSHKRSWQPQTHINSRTSQHRASGKKERLIVSVVMTSTNWFLIFEREELENLFPDMAIKLEGLTLGGNQCFVVIIALIILLLPTIWLDNLSLLWQLVTTSTSPPNSTDICHLN